MCDIQSNCAAAETLPRAKGPGDVYVLRQICHDWTDDDTLAILRSVRSAMGSHQCTLALVEVGHFCGVQMVGSLCWDTYFQQLGAQKAVVTPAGAM